MRCVNCGAELVPDKPFCPACGTQVAISCPTCGASFQAGFRFCPDCGAPLEARTQPASRGGGDDRLARLSRHIPADVAAKIHASRSLMAGERKLVTVLFCDLVGSTALAEGLDPEEYRDLLDEYLALAFREIYRTEGFVNQLAGDGLMALFGAPLAHEDAPDRAVLAALAIRDALGEFGRKVHARSGLDLQVRMGIHSGPVVVGTIGNDLKMDYTAVGDTTNLAAGLQTAAEPGAILMSEATHRLVLGLFHVEAVGPFELTGKREPVSAYRVIGQRPSATPMGIAVARGLTPLVGRTEELAHLRSCYERLGGHSAQVVALVGEAGSGKSRLLYEFKQQLSRMPAVFFEGRCSSLSRTIPYAPIASMLRNYFEVPADGIREQLCDSVASRMRAVDAQLLDSYPFLCQLLMAPVEGAADVPAGERKRETLEAVGRLVVTASEQNPVVMIIEDVQWIDELSRELLELAASRLERSRVMLVVSHRPDYEIAWRTTAAFTRLTLRRLPDEDTTAMIRALAGGPLPVELERRILDKADGNPFFTEELTRALLEEGHLVRTDGEVRLTRPVGEVAIPNTVQELVGARLDRLSGAAKRVAQVASVLGRQFRREQLAHVLEGSGIDVDAELDELERRGIIHRKNMLSDNEFRFGESLSQEVAYEGLLLRERRDLHGRIAHMLEVAPGKATAERSALVAHHFARSNDQGKAVSALLTAAADAEAAPSYATAVDLYQQAWDLAERMLTEGKDGGNTARRWALEATTSLCRVTIQYYGAPTTTGRAARRGRELADALGDTRSLVSLATMHGLHIMGATREDFGRGIAMVEEAAAIAGRADATGMAGGVSRALALGYLMDGRFAAARGTVDHMMEELKRSGSEARLAEVFFGACMIRETVRFYSDDIAGTLEEARKAYDLSIQARNRTTEAGFAAKLAQAYFVGGDYSNAIEWGQRSLRVAEQIDSTAAMLTGRAAVLAAGAALGAPTPSHASLLEDTLNVGSHYFLNVRLVVEAFLALGDLQRAERAAEMAYARAGGRLREALTASALGDVAVRRADWDAAAAAYERARRVAEAIGSRSALVAAQLGLAELAVARGDRRPDSRDLESALDICRAVGLIHDGRRAERLRSECVGPGTAGTGPIGRHVD